MKSLLIFITLAFSTVTFAGPGHGHSHGPVDTCKKLATDDIKSSSQKIGECHIARLIDAKKLNESWKNAVYEKSLTKEFKGNNEWLVTFNNQKGIKGKKLYIFLDLKGGFIAANFTGK